jgi:hypothetical protein
MIDNFASAIIKWFQNRLRLIYLAIAACENSCGKEVVVVALAKLSATSNKSKKLDLPYQWV